jgi:hypothetical protein
MLAIVEERSAIFDSACAPAGRAVRLEHRGMRARAGEGHGGGKAGVTGSDDGNPCAHFAPFASWISISFDGA